MRNITDALASSDLALIFSGVLLVATVFALVAVMFCDRIE
jgi:hypothetical protein